MTDRLTPAQRHDVMSRIHGKGTKPELKVRQWLWHHGYRYRLNVKSVPGKPDIVMRKYHTAIFVNGCFWHRCPYCNLPLPKHNSQFWREKFERNVARDKLKTAELESDGWIVITVWECQIKQDVDSVIGSIRVFL